MLMPMNGAAVEIKLDPVECETEATEAIALLDRYNEVLLAKDAPRRLASPSPQGCRWCPFQTICPAFWDAVSPTWSSELKSVVLAGALTAPLQTLHTGAFSMPVKIDAGTLMPSVVEVAPVDPRVAGILGDAPAGTRLRAIGLSTRLDGSVAQTKRTVIMKEADVPEIIAEPSSANDARTAAPNPLSLNAGYRQCTHPP